MEERGRGLDGTETVLSEGGTCRAVSDCDVRVALQTRVIKAHINPPNPRLPSLLSTTTPDNPLLLSSLATTPPSTTLSTYKVRSLHAYSCGMCKALNIVAMPALPDVCVPKSPATPCLHSGSRQGQLLCQPARQGGVCSSAAVPVVKRLPQAKEIALITRHPPALQVPCSKRLRAAHPSTQELRLPRCRPRPCHPPLRQRVRLPRFESRWLGPSRLPLR